jgi:hypothetical protein
MLYYVESVKVDWIYRKYYQITTHTICSLCEASIQINNQMFVCFICNDKHEMPKKGLPNNKSLLKILSAKLTRVSRGNAFDSLLKLLDEIPKNIAFLNKVSRTVMI